MKPFIKKSICALTVIILALLTAAAGLFLRIHYLESNLHPVTVPFSEMKTIPMCIDRIFPLSDLKKGFGFSDYVFIGEVEEILGTAYDEISVHRFRLIESVPETHFRVRSLHNIKGTVPEKFILKTHGGQQPDGSLEAYHTMPENKSTCLFMCTENEGNVYFFNCINLDGIDWSENSTESERVIEEYKEIYANEDLSVRKYR